MIEFQNVNKSYKTGHGRIDVLKDISFTLAKGEKIGILGRNGAGKSTLVRLLGGVELPTSGNIVHGMSVSWPLAFGGAFQISLTGIDNLRCICRIYGVDPRDKVPYVAEFSELGRFLNEPVRHYSSGMRARLAFAISMTIDFDCFLIDEVIAVGDAGFHAKCHEELFVKRADRAMVIVSHDPGYIRAHCQRAAVLSSGRLSIFDDMEEAFSTYSANYN